VIFNLTVLVSKYPNISVFWAKDQNAIVKFFMMLKKGQNEPCLSKIKTLELEETFDRK